jgi:cation diffusion facilitator CzcD-associated flavoprotein CzcO
MAPVGLEELVSQARRDFGRLNFPAPNWVPAVVGPDGRTMLDVLIIGAGLCGQTAAFALARDGVRNVRIIDRAERGREGPWGTYARMDTLRSPKHLTGPDLGFPALTFRAWYEAQHGAEGWGRLYKVATKDWLDYLLWVRDTVGLSIENNTEVTRVDPKGDGVRVELVAPTGAQTLFARKVVLAGGRDGSGAAYWPSFPSLAADSGGQFTRVFHSSADIDFARFEGGKIGILGASASAFDNAAVALEAGAAEAHLFARREHLPQINKSKWTAFAGFFLGFRQLDDETRWRIYSYIFGHAVPPPRESILRCERHAGFKVHFAEPWLDVVDGLAGVELVTAKARYVFDALIMATGFSVDLAQRRELARFHDKIALWGDCVSAQDRAAHPEATRFPYLGPGFELIERTCGTLPGLSHIHAFNAGSTMSHGALAGDIPGLAFGANRLSSAIVSSLFVASAEALAAKLRDYDDRELEGTPYFLPR